MTNIDYDQVDQVRLHLAAAVLGRKGGASKSAAKGKAARENGKKGGRLCSHANADGSARPWELRRFKAGHACHSCGRTLGTDGYWYIDADQAPGYPFDKTARKG